MSMDDFPSVFCLRLGNRFGIFFRRVKRQKLRIKCPNSELFWSIFSSIRTEYGEVPRIFPYSVRMWETMDQNNCEYGHFLRSANPFFSDNVLLNEMNLPVCDRNHKVCSTFSFNFVFKNISDDTD